MTENNSTYADNIAACLSQIRNSQPVIHSITNYVAMALNANALLAIGASPVMAHAVEEVKEMVQLAQALIINIGTIDDRWLVGMAKAMQAAQAKSIPIVVDPVGVGATTFRTQAMLSLMDTVAPQVIRGNAAEIMALADQKLVFSKGVDSTYASEHAYQAGKLLAERYQCIVVISGAQDFILDAHESYVIENGDPLMSKVTGMGCTATALIGAFCAVQSHYLMAAVNAMAVMGIAGELALPMAQGPGSFQVQFLDTLYNLKLSEIALRLKLKRISA